MVTTKTDPFGSINGFIFITLLVAGGLAFLWAPKDGVSLAEKRRLAPLPNWSVASVLSGDFARQVDAYYSDHFVLRDQFLGLADRIKVARGFASGDFEVVDTARNVRAATARPTPGSGKSAISGAPDDASVDDDDGDYANVRSVIIYKGKAVQIATGSYLTAARFANVANAYHNALGPAVKVYCMAIPVGSDFYLPHAINHGEARERDNIRKLYADLEPGVIGVDAYGQLSQHIGEYIYYRTDHHWTGLGAYYAYRAFAVAAGFTPLPLSALKKGTIDGFLGSLYYYTRSDTLKNNIDHVDYYMVPYETQEYIYRSAKAEVLLSHTYEQAAKGGNAYGVFIGGDHPLVKIVSKAGGSRKILVIKDSYGNAFVPYLAAHYSEVWVVDYRYFWGSISQLVRDHGIGEVLLAHNTYVINGQFAANRALKMLRGGTQTPALVTDRPIEVRRRPQSGRISSRSLAGG